MWQWEFGNPSRNGYHNKEWAAKMEEVGLMPSETGEPGGKKTGQRMTHYVIPEGNYEKAFQKMPETYTLPFTSLEGDIMRSLLTGISGIDRKSTSVKKAKLRPKSRSKTKYSCPNCEINVWGKPNLNIRCGDCDESLTVVD